MEDLEEDRANSAIKIDNKLLMQDDDGSALINQLKNI